MPISLVVLYAVSAVYFAGVMVRLMLTLTPIVCVLASISISHTLDSFMKNGNSSKEGMCMAITVHMMVESVTIFLYCTYCTDKLNSHFFSKNSHEVGIYMIHLINKK